MDHRWDLAIYDRQNRLVLTGEVKNRKGTTPAWAAQYRRNMNAHGGLPDAPFFLLATPDFFYLWYGDNKSDLTKPITPDYIIDAKSIIGPYLNGVVVSSEQINSQSLEFIVFSWLSNLIRQSTATDSVLPQWIKSTGLQEMLPHANVVYEIAA